LPISVWGFELGNSHPHRQENSGLDHKVTCKQR
jgi:hypothetical protein